MFTQRWVALWVVLSAALLSSPGLAQTQQCGGFVEVTRGEPFQIFYASEAQNRSEYLRRPCFIAANRTLEVSSQVRYCFVFNHARGEGESRSSMYNFSWYVDNNHVGSYGERYDFMTRLISEKFPSVCFYNPLISTGSVSGVFKLRLKPVRDENIYVDLEVRVRNSR